MKKGLIILLTVFVLFALTACGAENNYMSPSEEESTPTQEEKKKNNEQTNQIEDDYIYDDEIIEWDDEDNGPYEEEKVVVEKVINCDGCVYAYFSGEGDKAKVLGSTLSKDEYTTDVTNLKTMGGKQRHNFFGLILSGDKISRAYACILKDNKIYCIEGSVDGSHHTSNVGILNQIFTADQCKYISAGHTYTCTDGDYNGDTQTTGYTSLHYETSCVIYGSSGNTGKLICH